MYNTIPYVALLDGVLHRTVINGHMDNLVELHHGIEVIKSLEVAGHVDLTEVTSRNIKVHKIEFDNKNSTGVVLPPNLVMEAGVVKMADTDVTSLPDGLVLSYLSLSGSSIKTLPDDLVVTEYLNISNTAITSLPVGVRHAEVIDISGTAIHELPGDIDCKSLNFEFTPITDIPTTIKVHSAITTSSHISVIPDTIEAMSINTDATTIPVRNYSTLRISRSDVLQCVKNVDHIKFNTTDNGDDVLIIPPHIRALTSLVCKGPVHMHPDLTITGTLSLIDNDDNIIPDTVILPTFMYLEDVVGPDADLFHFIHRYVMVSTTSKTYKMIADVFLTNVHGIYETTPDTVRIKGNDYKVFNIILVNKLLPNRKIIMADGNIEQYSSTRTVGEYTVCRTHTALYCKYVVTDGVHCCHCTTIQEGIEGIINKRIVTTTLKKVKVDPDLPIAVGDAIHLYRLVTGACRPGIQSFLDHLKESGLYKDSYTVKEILSLTENRYGHDRFALAVSN